MEGLFKSSRCDESSPIFSKAIHREKEMYSRNDSRSEFQRDYTRILHSKAFSRLKHKTQVFYETHNDHTCTRIEHVLHVASVSRIISDYMGLNTELSEAIAIGHDIGHAPFGHEGENVLARILKDHKVGGIDSVIGKSGEGKPFWHERNSLFFADYIETLSGPDGSESLLNLTYGVRDGLICHCGEIDQESIHPRKEAIDLYDIKTPGLVQPFTWEGCVVKVSDKIAYLGRDLEDARRYHIIDMKAYRVMRELIGDTLHKDGDKLISSLKSMNASLLMNTLINDLLQESSPEKGLCFSSDYFNFIKALKSFNYNYIYTHWKMKKFVMYASLVLETIFDALMNAYGCIKKGKINTSLRYCPTLSSIFEKWLLSYTNYNEDKYRKNFPVFNINDETSYFNCVIEFISGMTDAFAIKVYEEIISF